MNQNLEHLMVLQAQDLELAQLRRAVAEAPQKVQKAQDAVAQAEQAATTATSALLAEEKLRRGQESEIGTQRAKVGRLKQSLDGATSAAQITAFENQISFAEAAIARLEEEEYASMERTEALEAEAGRARTLAAERGQAAEAERTRSAQQVSSAKEQIAGLETQRTELRQQVEERALAAYDRLKSTRGTAVAEALGNATTGRCGACQMGVRPQRWQNLTGRDHDDEIFTCESCGRMLFWDPRRDTPKAWELGDRFHKAQAGSSR